MGSDETQCRQCKEVFRFDAKRKWFAIAAVIGIIFGPTLVGVTIDPQSVTLMTAIFKYLSAVGVFYIINGRA
ncbi:MAG: hypothetical protein AAF402_16920 [Pseudomonadota bacterium]